MIEVKMNENIEERARKAGANTRELIESTQSNLKNGMDQLEAQVKAHPMLVISISVLAGIVLGKFLSNNRN